MTHHVRYILRNIDKIKANKENQKYYDEYIKKSDKTGKSGEKQTQ